MLVVEGTSQYNDSMTAAFRHAAVAAIKGSSVLYSYIDGTTQAGFLTNFEHGISREEGLCEEGTKKPRRVSEECC